MHGTTCVLVVVRKAAGQIEKRVARARGKPDIVRVEEDAVLIIRINGDALV
jgi:hypothetical protein